MPLDPNIILQAGNFPKLDGVQILNNAMALSSIGQAQDDRRIAAQDMQALNARLVRQDERQERADVVADAAQGRRATLGSMAAGGDFAGAQRGALESGDLELVKQFQSLSDDQRKRAVDLSKAAAPVLFQALQAPPELRKNVFAAATPDLVAQGFTPEQIAQFDPSDQWIKGKLAAASTLSELQSQFNSDRTFKAGRDDAAAAERRARAALAAAAGEGSLNRANSRGNAVISASASAGKLVQVPAAAANGILGNSDAVRKVDAAIKAIRERPGSVGYGTGMLGKDVTNFNDPGGTATRAVIADLSATKIHDLSGAAVSASEFPRIAPLVPLVDDSPEVVEQKLLQMRKIITGQIDQQKQFYGPQNGYKPVRGVEVAPLVEKNLPAGGGVLKPGVSDVPPDIAAILARNGRK